MADLVVQPDELTLDGPYVEACETHSGLVLLMGARAYKFKKPIDLGFLDFTEVETRWDVCRREVDLNRRLCPDAYLGVGHLVVPDHPSEPVVVMRRMPTEARLSHLVVTKQATPAMVREIARRIAAFHGRAERGEVISHEGTRDAISARWEASFEQCRPFRSTVFDESLIAEIESLVRSFLAGRSPLFDARVAEGRVVDGHGDLIAEDIFCLPDGPRILDCLEFDDHLRYLDQLDDIAFLAMDLEHLGATDLATSLLERYVEFASDPAPPTLRHHFIAYRAFVRAKVFALRSAQRGSDPSSVVESRRFAALARHHLREGVVNLVLVGGPPGTGKTTLAGDIADDLGMVVLSSDRLRKEMAGLDPLASAAASFGHGLYAPEWTERTYAELLDRAARLLARGESVVLDASWSDPSRRRAAEELAERSVAALVSLRCSLDPKTADSRIRARRGISDADVAVATAMRRSETPWPGSVDIDTSQTRSDTTRAARLLIRPWNAAIPHPARPMMAPD